MGSAADLSLPVQSTSPGSSVVVSLALDSGTDSVSGLQFDLQYDSAAMSIVTTPGGATRSAGKIIYYNDLSPNVRRFLVIGFNQDPIPSGDVLDLILNVSPAAVSGAHPLTLLNITSTGISGSTVSMTASNGALIVGGTSGSRLQPSGVLNAASLASGPVAPGEILTLIGSGIGPPIATQPISSVTSTVLSGISVLLDGNPVPLLYAAPNQVNAIVPYEISGQSVTQLSIMSGGQVIAGFPLSVVASSPALFTLDGSGTGPGAILNQDSSINSALNPASPGSIVVLFANGAGPVNPTPADGQVIGSVLSYPTLPVSVSIGGLDAQILYAGAAPGLVAGVLQVNCVVPQNVTPGDSVPVQINVGTVSSPVGVVLAVQ